MNTKHDRASLFVALLIVFISIGFPGVCEGDSGNPYKILVFYSFQPGTPWQDHLAAAFSQEISNNTEIETEIISDYPWILVEPDLEYEQQLTEFYKYKYDGQQIDIIVSTSTLSTKFLLKFGDIIFPDVPVIALPGPSAETLEQVKLKSGWRAVFSEKKIRETIDLAVNLQPHIENIAVISGASQSGRTLEKYCREILADYPHKLNPVFLTNMPMGDIIQGVADLPPHTAVIYLTSLMDSTGEEFIPVDILKDITEASNAPVYGLWDTILGTGIVGGYMVSPDLDGRSLAKVVIGTLNDGNLPPEKVSFAMNAYYFDWNQLKRWHIDVDDLPPGSVLINQKFSFWDLYKFQFIAAVFIILLESLLIITLLLQRANLKKTKRSLIESRHELEDKVLRRTEQLSWSKNELEKEIMEHKEAKLDIQNLLKGKEVLLTEVHHRIKNNMLSLSAILSLKAQDSQNFEVSEILDDTARRIHSMMLLYDKLYKGTDYKNIPVKEYFNSLLIEITQNFQDIKNIHVETEIEDLVLDANTVLNIGIILNELITNSCKYAFPDASDGEIRVKAFEGDEDYNFIIEDSGIGFDGDLNDDSTLGFGLKLVQILTEQLNGELVIERDHGIRFIIRIPKKAAAST